jgi:hypothetical protein
MIEGGGSRHYIHTKRLMYSEPQLFDLLLTARLPPLCSAAYPRTRTATQKRRRSHHLLRNRYGHPAFRDSRNWRRCDRPRLAHSARSRMGATWE